MHRRPVQFGPELDIIQSVTYLVLNKLANNVPLTIVMLSFNNNNNVIYTSKIRQGRKCAFSIDSSEEESFQFIFQKMSSERSSTGRLFHTAEPLTRKLRSP